MTQTSPPGTLIGLTGRMGAGKDATFERLQALFGDHVYKRLSFAATLKESAAALFGLTIEQLEMMKNEPTFRVTVVNLKGYGQELGRSLSVREMLQRYGVEAHREITGFGHDIWVDAAMRQLDAARRKDAQRHVGPYAHVFTDVRFENEAQAIKDAGGVIVEIVGPKLAERPDEDEVPERDHSSEGGVPQEMIDFTIDNSTRPSFEEMSGDPEGAREAIDVCMGCLDDEVARLHGWLGELRGGEA